ncbi:MAG: energy-coupling factor transporter transmembrane protein EcfT [Chloroflexota bacterium]|nr:energy-coupling factor transporter transmembrane protein EcfT [Chloroflexota bacterium]
MVGTEPPGPESTPESSDQPPPAFLSQPGPSAYHRLNPLTKLVLATVIAVAAVIIGGIAAPVVLLIFAVGLPAASAGLLRRLLRTSLLLSLPIGISALLVNLFFFPGGRDVLFQLGPITATQEGLGFALEILARILAISGAITLFYLTTPPNELVTDLERRGVSPRLAFVASSSVQTVPAMVERASTIVAAQRARGLDTEGGFIRRLRGLLPIVGPVIMGSIAEVEERSMALEARGFTRPGRRTLLWAPADSTAQRLARWLLAVALVGLIGARLSGSLGPLP